MRSIKHSSNGLKTRQEQQKTKLNKIFILFLSQPFANSKRASNIFPFFFLQNLIIADHFWHCVLSGWRKKRSRFRFRFGVFGRWFFSVGDLFVLASFSCDGICWLIFSAIGRTSKSFCHFNYFLQLKTFSTFTFFFAYCRNCQRMISVNAERHTYNMHMPPVKLFGWIGFRTYFRSHYVIRLERMRLK